MGKKKGKAAGKKKKVKDLGPTPAEIAQMEGELQAKVAEVSTEIEGLKTSIDELREENLKLHEESTTLKDDTQARFLQGIQLLKDQQLASVHQQRADARSGYQRRRAALQHEITTRSQELVLAQKQLQDLEPVRLKYSLQDELQRELDDVKEHASSVAQQCLGNYVSRVREENATLRGQLKERIDENKLLESEFRRQSHIRNEQLRERSYRSGIIRRLQEKLSQL
ncbi:hypothetical protein FJT64_018604 [Amphibalanus amphitrite]|uniref:DUF4515 domain-containing protein n=1 Tax=Amphibalanus amphitrite TaxID=1232801 RepID=A0A6A4X7T6_AMPAM|nr:hypothetical protein FJT64_018604 [Amphibalanus amphitrite]